VNAGSTAGERRTSAADDVPDLHSRPRDRACGSVANANVGATANGDGEAVRLDDNPHLDNNPR
jgi:hypothetical protein